tara:strand:+ start:372 stop:1163 length:792 start_codon:yes stop_codon:yes gene_type:complete
MPTTLPEIIVSTDPGNGDVGIPLQNSVTILFDRAMDHERLREDFFVEGPDTDQWIGPGLYELKDPANVSQGDLDDFLKSPGYRGIVQGSFVFQYVTLTDSSVEVVPDGTFSNCRTKLIFTPTQPWYPILTYTVHIVETLDALGTVWPGYVGLSFESGSGSIEQLPASISSSILTTGAASTTATSGTALAMLTSSPVDLSINNSSDLSEITITFDKDLDATTITNSSVIVEASVASDHPNLTATAKGKLAKALLVNGKTLTIKI